MTTICKIDNLQIVTQMLICYTLIRIDMEVVVVNIMNFNKKVTFVLAFISLFISLSLIQVTYSKYQTTTNGTADMQIARWKISVNNEDITTSTALTNKITPIFSGNSNIRDGYIAPKSEGYFDVVIDTTNVDVSFKYQISTSVADDSDVKDLVVTGYSMNGGEIIPVSGNINDISNTILYSNVSQRTINLRIYISWLDGDGETMDNASDTAATLKTGTAKLMVLLSFVQVAN